MAGWLLLVFVTAQLFTIRKQTGGGSEQGQDQGPQHSLTERILLNLFVCGVILCWIILLWPNNGNLNTVNCAVPTNNEIISFRLYWSSCCWTKVSSYPETIAARDIPLLLPAQLFNWMYILSVNVRKYFVMVTWEAHKGFKWISPFLCVSLALSLHSANL